MRWELKDDVGKGGVSSPMGDTQSCLKTTGNDLVVRMMIQSGVRVR